MIDKEMREQVDGLFAKYNEAGSPGCMVAVIKDGQIIYQQGYGLANVDLNVPITPATRFNIGSESKQFTAMAILLLAQDGRLALDDDIRAHLPEAPDFGATITIRHLLLHTSGLRCSFPPLLMLGGWHMADLTTNEDIYRLFLAQRELNFPPGSEFSYANMGYAILAKIVERVSEGSFADYCQEKILTPLGMEETVINDDPFKIIPNRGTSYYRDDAGKLYRNLLADGAVGPTNVYTTAGDLALWDENFYTGKVGGLPLIAQMQETGQLKDGRALDYAAGLFIHEHRGYKLVEHGGEHGGFVASLLRFPEIHFSVIVMSNLFTWNVRGLAMEVVDLFLEDKSTSPEVRTEEVPDQGDKAAVIVDEAQLEKLTGLYFHEERVALREVLVKDGVLYQNDFKLQPAGETVFTYEVNPAARLIFTAGEDGRATQAQIVSDSTGFIYKRVEQADPAKDELREYEGLYHSPELNVFWTVELAGDGLIVKHQRYPESHLRPIFVDGFKDDWQNVLKWPYTYFWVFERDESGAISGCRVSEERMRHLRFVKLVVQ